MRLLVAGFVLLASGLLFADHKPVSNPHAKQHHVRAKYHARKMANSAGCEHVVTVINGDSPMTTCSDVLTAPVGSSQSAGKGPATQSTMSGRVEIINGTSWSTRTFSATDKQLDLSLAQRAKAHPVVTGIASSATETEKPQPVVVAVASSEMAGGAGTDQPVVIGIASSGTDRSRSVAPGAVDVAPIAPKRPPYHRPNPQ